MPASARSSCWTAGSPLSSSHSPVSLGILAMTYLAESCGRYFPLKEAVNGALGTMESFKKLDPTMKSS